MHQLTEFSAIIELTPLGLAHRIFQANHTTFGQVYLLQTPVEGQKLNTLLPCPDWSNAKTLAAFSDAMHHYQVIAATPYPLSFNQVQQQIQLGQQPVLKAIQSLAIILQQAHKAGYILTELKAEALFWSDTLDQACLLSCPQASILHAVHPIQNLSALELQKLRTLAPEVSGRVHCPLDQRADLYAFGVLAYALIANEFPFQQQEPLALIHAHIAKEPQPLHQLKADCDVRLSLIVQALLQKDPNRRYQNIDAVLEDLYRCQQPTDHDQRFTPAVFSGLQALPFPEQLYEREQDLARLFQAFHAVKDTAQGQLVTVRGYSGAGKTSLIEQLHPKTLGHQTFFLQGKHDQYLQERFFSALRTVFAQLAEVILQEPDSELQHWRQQLQQAAAEDGQLLCELVPEWQPLLQPVATADTSATSLTQLARFDRLTLRLLQLVTERGYNLILFLDDMQWADRATLRWLEQLASAAGPLRLLLLLSYRDHEVTDKHPLHFTLQSLQHGAMQQHSLTLKPLSSQATLQLVADTLQLPPAEVNTLAELLLQKTSGNPFYLKQLMQKLYQTGLLQCDLNGHWHWDSKAIAQLDITDNHAAITAERLHRFPAETQSLFQWIALLGETAHFSQLAQLAQTSVSELENQLAAAINTGILIAFTSSNGQQIESIRFAHDRLQQAAFQLSDEQTLKQLHLQIALQYYHQLPPQQQDAEVLQYLPHFNAALPLSLEHLSFERLAQLNLLAGQKALSSNAYHSALQCCNQSWQLLQDHHPQHPLLPAVLRGLSQSAYLTQQYDAAWVWCQQLVELSEDPVLRMQNCQQQILILFAQNQLSEAFELACQQLQEVGLEIHIHQNIVQEYETLLSLYDASAIQRLRIQAKVQDPVQLQSMQILGILFTVAYIVSPLHFITVSYHLMKLSLTQGHSNASPLGYLGHAMNLIALFGQYSKALEFADLALQVDADFGGTYRAQLNFQRASAVLPWNAPLTESLQALEASQHLGLQDGQLEYAAHSALFSSFYRVMSGQPLTQVQQLSEQSIQFLTEKQFPYNLAFTRLWHQLTLALQGPASSGHLLEGEAFAESTQLEELQQPQNSTLLFCYHCIKLMQAWWFATGDEQTHLQQAEPLVDVALALYHQTEFYFFRGLTAARLLKQTDSETATLWQTQLQHSIEKLENWARQNPENHLHKVRLLQAEEAALAQQASAWQSYQQAIELAEQHGFTQHAGLAHELAADYWQSMQQHSFALEHRARAWRAYQQWQAFAKTEHLLLKFPELRQHPLLQASQAAAIDQQLDLASVLKAAEALTGRVDLHAYLQRMLLLMVENAGADHGCLLLLSEQQLEMQATTMDGPPALPQKLLNLVQRSMKSRLLNDTSQTTFFHDVKQPPCAVLCLPIVVNATFRGLVYLQHQHLVGAFQQERVQVLQLLANQTAILFENTRLSQQLLEANKNLEQKVTSRTRELADAKIKAEAATEAKSAFLARMSHEIRTPINAVIGLSRLATKNCPEPELLDTLGKIRSSGEMLLSLVNDILDFSKIEAGKLRLENTRFALSPVVQQAINMTALKAHSKGLELVSDLSSDLPHEFNGDPLRLQQLLVNLLNNAIKFTESGSVCLMLHGTPLSQQRFKLHGSVTDTGIGMTEQQQRKLFQSFNQADESITRKYGGSGLGLSICKQLCELMAGEIWLESEAGYGTTFYFTIELNLPAQGYEHQRKRLATRQLKALVVDDMALTRMVLLKQLDELGVQAEQCSNGLDAIERVDKAASRGEDYDFILMDWRMPGMDGIETSRSIQHKLGARSPRILMVSAYDKAAAKACLQDVRIDLFLEKPVNYSMLLDALSPLLFTNQIDNVSRIPPEPTPVPDLTGKRLLLVEDHPINQQVALGFIQETSAQIDCAENGLVALQLLQRNSYDLVLMDIQMPEMDGLTASRHIRTKLGLTELPILAMTAHALPEDIERSQAAGMNAHLTKPIAPELLYQKLQQLLQATLKPASHTSTDSAMLYQKPSALLDETRARVNLGSQAAIYPSLLHIFYHEHKTLPDKLRHQLQSHDTEALRRSMHSLKAAAAYIGAFSLADACNQLEAKLQSDEVDTSSIEEVLALLQPLLDSLQQQVNQTNLPAEKSLDRSQLRAELQRLEPLLLQSDFAAEQLLTRLCAQTKDSEFAAKIEQLNHTVADVEFEQAHRLLQALLQQLPPA